MNLLLLDVPAKFYKHKLFFCDNLEIETFCTYLQGQIEGNKVELLDINPEETAKYHSGDCRIYLKDGRYTDLIGDKFIMLVKYNEYYEDIFEWMKEYIPSLYIKHMT